MTGAQIGIAVWQSLQLAERELLAFAAFWFAVGLLDELALDLVWIGLRLRGRTRTAQLPRGFGGARLAGSAAVLIPAWREAPVIAATLRHALAAWPHRELTIYAGVYHNDRETLAAAMAGAGIDPRVRLVVLGRAGPTTKADCLNRLYAAMRSDEARGAFAYRSVTLHDAEDMVHPDALAAIDAALDSADFVQLPVRPEIVPGSRWVSAHYADEFAEAHAKAMVVRGALGAAIPAAGVGCGFARDALERLAMRRHRAGEGGPFAEDCLTEDYELGLRLSREGRGSRFLRLRDADGQLVATRSYFPATLDTAVRQKTRWLHGIAFQGWERLGWNPRPLEVWMALRDRRGPLTAVVLGAAYLLLVIDAVLLVGHALGAPATPSASPPIRALLWFTTAGFAWRVAARFVFTAREYGWREGLIAVPRIFVSNLIAIIAGRSAFAAYWRSLRGEALHWDKTAHHGHPTLASAPA